MIDRAAVVGRHTIRYHEPRPEAPLSVGNGELAFTVDHTGLQTFADRYERNAARTRGERAMPLGTQAQWGYHWAPNPEGHRLGDTLERHDSPRGTISYPTAYDYMEDRAQSAASGRAAGYYFWVNPQRLHLAKIGLLLDGATLAWDEVVLRSQVHDLWTGLITSHLEVEGVPVEVRTAVDPERDAIAFAISSDLLEGRLAVEIAFPGVEESFEAPPVWDQPEAHSTTHRREGDAHVWDRRLDEATYQARATGSFDVTGEGHRWVLSADGGALRGVVDLAPVLGREVLEDAEAVFDRSAREWESFWRSGAALDLSGSTDERALELERRIVLSQYQTKVHSSGSTPPQETGLICNSWGGTFHLEMHWWHAAHFPVWGRPELLERSLAWYRDILPVAQQIAADQGFRGARWPKHVGPEGVESPNVIGPLLLWQQPHVISYAELIRMGSADPAAVRERYRLLVDETAAFLASFALVGSDGAFHLPPPLMPAQEVYGARDTWDPLFEVTYVRWALETALAWRRADGREEPAEWAAVAAGLRPVVSEDGHYDAVQNPPRTMYRDHPSMLGALGVVPDVGALDHGAMLRTLERACEQWDWRSAWGWDFPMIAMCATRLGRSDIALDALLRGEAKNTYLANGHNQQVPHRMPLYLPGNGGLLMAAALLFGGWVDGEESPQRVELPAGWVAAVEGFPARP